MNLRKLVFCLLAFFSTCDFTIANENLNVAQELFSFLTSEHGHNGRLGRRLDLLNKWLSPKLASYGSAIECDAEIAWKEEQRPLKYVSAEIFFDRWDPPSYCEASAPRLIAGKQTSIVECRWGKGKDHLEGDTIQLFADVAEYSGHLKVENVRHGRQEFAGETKTDLLARMLTATMQSDKPEYCRKKHGI